MRNLGLIILGTFALVLAACQSSPTAGQVSAVPSSASVGSAQTTAATESQIRPTVQDTGGGGVTVEATWLGRRDGGMAFQIAFNTHSVDLSRFDAAANMALRDASGREVAASGWQDENGDSHHRSGVVTFSVPTSGEQGGRATLIVRNLAGVAERLLAFDAKG